MSQTTARAIGPIGTASRAALGAALITVAITLEGIGWWDLAAVLTVLPGIAVIAVSLARTANRVVAGLAVIAAVVGLGTLLTFVTPVDRGAVVLFVSPTCATWPPGQPGRRRCR